MKNFSTRCMDEQIHKINKNGETAEPSPRKKTLDFLTQFARVYHAEPGLKIGTCDYVMN